MRLTTSLLTSVISFASLTAFTTPASDPLNLNWGDKNTSIKDNFYIYANGNWKKNNPIPPEHSNWSIFKVLEQQNQKKIHQIILDAAADKHAKPGSIEQKIGDFYLSGMNQASINLQGLKPLEPFLSRIHAIQSQQQLLEEIVELHKMAIDVFFGSGSMQDFANSNRMIAAVVQGGLGLPDRDYYLKKDAKFNAIRNAYIDYLKTLFVLSGDTAINATTAANTVMQIETALATASMSQTAQRNPHAIYHMMGITQLEKIAPNIDWSTYFSTMGFPETKHLNVAMPHFLHAMSQELQRHSMDEWKLYLRAHLLDAYAPYLSQAFVDANFHLTSVLTGVKKQKPRWKQVVDTENHALGFAIGKMYVQR